ncbi:hypothetical protein BJY24_007077 [Nocardia transvalensis]|uniref:Lipoprotein n=1 Tax=Nocardia transvalensis TaxID=37333 RepID=A0A7W9UMU9_9NOCA|nr:hypothetical protein [Nocardia transvalensis]MBB5918165.1 hypothetical protein [Nocardia transvalensis]
MSQSRWMTRGALGAAVVAAAALIAGCGGGGSTGSAQPSGTSGSATSTAAHSSGSATVTGSASKGPLEVPDQAAKALCDKIQVQLSDWRVQGPTLSRVALNITVHEWAATEGGINGRVLGDKAVVDRITTTTCSDVHTQAIQALELPDLASGIAF